MSAIVAAVVLYLTAFMLFSYLTESSTRQKVEIYCSTDENEYYYEVYFDENFQIRESGGDAWIANHIQTEQYSNVNVLIAQMEDYFNEHEMEYEIVWE